MNTTYFSVFILLCLSFCQSSVLSVHGQTQTNDKVQEAAKENEFLIKLKKRLEENVRLFKNNELGMDLPPSLQNLYSNIHKPLEYQIEKAEDRIKRGLSFGKKEYDEALKAMEKHVKEDNAKRIKEADIEYRQTLKKSEQTFQRNMDETQRKFEKSRRETDRDYKLRINASNLEYKFKMAPSPPRLVLWNLPVDRKMHDRYTTGVNILLYSKGKKVWSKTNVKLDRRIEDNHFELPKIFFDRILVELIKWQGVGGGLAEIEVFLGTDNVAALRPCQVSNSETVPRYLDDQNSLTDGVRVSNIDAEGYWIAEEEMKATVSVNLIGEKVNGQ